MAAFRSKTIYLFVVCLVTMLTESRVISFSPALAVPLLPSRYYYATSCRQQPSLSESKEEWNEKHLIHGAKEIHEETKEEMLESEEAAALDAHNLSDSGMEAVMMERAVIMANEMAHKYKEKAEHGPVMDESKKDNWNEKHLIHGAKEIHEETKEEMLESEEAAALDAHDLSDSGMEAVMMERAVIMANEMAHKYKENAKRKKNK